MTKSISIILVGLMILALAAWMLQGNAADDDVARLESCELAQTALGQGVLDGRELTPDQRAAFERQLAECDG